MQQIYQLSITDRVKNTLASWQETSRIIVHEIKNKLSPLNLDLEYLNNITPDNSECNEIFHSLKRNIQDISRIIYNFLSVANLPEPVLTKIKLDGFCNELVKKNRLDNITQLLSCSSDNYIFSDPVYLDIIISNLLINAKESINKDIGLVKMIIKNYKMQIMDNGHGIKQEWHKKIFASGFTTKKDGTGMGLFLVKELCQVLNIQISLKILSSPISDSIQEKWTNFTLDFKNVSIFHSNT